jgi:hypothetical protein
LKSNFRAFYKSIFDRRESAKMSDAPSSIVADAKIPPGDDYEEIREQVGLDYSRIIKRRSFKASAFLTILSFCLSRTAICQLRILRES